MFNLDTNIPLQSVSPLPTSDQMQSAVTLANMLDARRETKKAINKREQVLKIFNNPPIDQTTGDLNHEQIYRQMLPIDSDAAEHYKTNIQTALIQKANEQRNAQRAIQDTIEAQQGNNLYQQKQESLARAEGQLGAFNAAQTQAQEGAAIANEPTMRGVNIPLSNDTSFANDKYNAPSMFQSAQTTGLSQAAGVLPEAKSVYDTIRDDEKSARDAAEAERLQQERLVAAKDAKDVQMAGIKANKDIQLGQKEDQRNSDRLSKMSKDLDPSAMVRGAFSVSKQVIDRADRLRTLDNAVNAYQAGNADSRQIEELAIGMNSLLSGSNTGAQQQVAALVPKTAIGNASKMYEFLSGQPQGTNQQEFVKRMLVTIEREKQTAENQIKKTRMSRIAQYNDVAEKDPIGFADVLRSWEIEPEEYAAWKKNGYKQPDVARQGNAVAGIKIGRFNVTVK